jgi:hypothetical protein
MTGYHRQQRSLWFVVLIDSGIEHRSSTFHMTEVPLYNFSDSRILISAVTKLAPDLEAGQGVSIVNIDKCFLQSRRYHSSNLL